MSESDHSSTPIRRGMREWAVAAAGSLLLLYYCFTTALLLLYYCVPTPPLPSAAACELAAAACGSVGACSAELAAYVSIRQHTSAYVSVRQHTSESVSIRQHTSAYGQQQQLGLSVHAARKRLRRRLLRGLRASRSTSSTCQYLYFCTSKASKPSTCCCVG